ncbi:putative transcription factor C2H2 family [Helianthus annuus]|uniref:RING-type E3 ubiquitin transferase n=1 Tax=Helianthus annuus TaxID=4232 RepID=A0A251VHT5_HELAN|nr:RING-H2 finger protein ATL34 [Helianthus annuus]KAF5799113.1 putative transcription factor C2H2 family [Helianthus annuus]KAJ0550592.1 putative transcription factor C2H2 family [Helianthus annuus]KAJ0557373.1 putative transcription factor C2H2 family [Helianthus annuus]KAJ0563561.1 putative transcription factor C2H2 family [Helianthus annuus]KAJ0728891.1 putative transcription factor C2H2 family [Helianthus annuus]
MNTTSDTVAPPYTTPGTTVNPPGSHDYLFLVGFFCTVILLITITYASCSCFKASRSPPPPSITHDDGYNDRFSRGLDDDVIVTFPTFVYSETRILDHKFDNSTYDKGGSGCSICLEDYKPADVVRLFPDCGHLFHVTCIDTWLKGHATCPVCRNFAGIDLKELT